MHVVNCIIAIHIHTYVYFVCVCMYIFTSQLLVQNVMGTTAGIMVFVTVIIGVCALVLILEDTAEKNYVSLFV